MSLNQKIGFFIVTLGCRANQSDSDKLIDLILSQGDFLYSSIENSKYVIINTCTVTKNADSDVIRAIKSVKKINPKIYLIVTGCTVVANAAVLKDFEIDSFIDNKNKFQIPEILFKREEIANKNINITDFSIRTRGFIKIQEGCNNNCSYCIVPIARGKSVSKATDEIITEINYLVDVKKKKEIVVTGIHIGQWRDKNKGISFLIKNILDFTKINRVRLSSLSPDEIDEELLELFKNEMRLCPHIHLSVQNLNDDILVKMNRGFYNKKTVIELCEKLKIINPDIFIGMDYIVGFPGETNLCFEENVKIINALPVSKIHVFPFSERPGTQAVHFGEVISLDERLKRSKIIRGISDQKYVDFLAGQVNKEVRVLFERRTLEGKFKGLSSNFIPVVVDTKENLKNKIERVLINSVIIKKNNSYLLAVLTKGGYDE